MENSAKPKDTGKGHRKRLREKLLRAGIEGLNDYEIIELLLTLGTPRRDCKQQAKEALNKFGNLRNVLDADPEELAKIKGIGRHNIFGLKFVHETAKKYLRDSIIKKDALKSSSGVFDYLYHSMRGMKREVFKVLFLDTRNRIIDTEDIFTGTISSSFIYPREIVKSAIKFNASGLIFAHNHPSGDPGPSEDDRNITRQLVSAGSLMQIKILDHIIIGENRYYSFADEGLISQYYGEL